MISQDFNMTTGTQLISKQETNKLTFGVETILRFEGNDLDLANAIYIERCKNIKNITSKEEKHSGTAIEVSCTPEAPSSLSESYGYDDYLRYILKYAPAAIKITEGSIPASTSRKVEMMAIDPSHPVYDQKTNFTISGANLTKQITSKTCDLITVDEKKSTAYALFFSCIPRLTANITSENDLEWFENHPLIFTMADAEIQATPLTGAFADTFPQDAPQKELSKNGDGSQISITKIDQQQRIYKVTFNKKYPLFANIEIEQCSPLERMVEIEKSYRCYMAVADHIDVLVKKLFSGTIIDSFSYPIREVFQYEVKNYEPGRVDAILELQGVGLPKKALKVEGGPCENEMKNLEYGTPTAQGFKCELINGYNPTTTDISLKVIDNSGVLLFEGFEKQLERE